MTMPALDDFASGGLHTADEIEQNSLIDYVDWSEKEPIAKTSWQRRCDLVGFSAVNHRSRRSALVAAAASKPRDKSTGFPDR
jgi:hypothetical protein